ncbi:MAG: M20/M25/M40 family metallo-hydrolase, partial [Clostridia bacterium]|nr:M20/M25/M40 family metallo-hydrolase [Clostridia bacterium]
MKEWIESHFREHYELLKELCVIPAPSHKEERRVDRLLEILREMGYEAHSDEAKNVLVPLFDAGETDITVYAAHIDVVFPDETPLPLYEEGGKLFCPGCGDNTANAAAILTILRYVKEKGLKPKDPLLFAFDSCEEGLGNLKGVRAIMSAYSGRIKEFVSFDCMLDEMITGAIGSERWRVTAKTRGGHSWG